jgi:signal transduction histidine kinase
VADSGPGIPRDQQEAIFEPFVQLDRSFTRSVEGVGLGLAISRDLARGMGGDLTVESEPGKGARFSLTLPAGILDSATQMERTLETSAIGRKNV